MPERVKPYTVQGMRLKIRMSFCAGKQTASHLQRAGNITLYSEITA